MNILIFLKKTIKNFINWCHERSLDLFITLIGLAAIFGATGYVHFWAPAGWEKHTRVISIQSGMPFKEIAKILEDNGIVRDQRSFYLLARLQEAIPKVKAGEYEMHTNMKPLEVLWKLIKGEVIKYPVTIPEGYNIFQVAETLEKAGVCNKKKFLEKARDPDFLASLGFNEESLEGYLFPDTYNFPKMMEEEQVIRQMVSRFKVISAPLATRAQELGLSLRDVVILASLIEKEAVDDQERRLISAVFHNRLQRGMPLQSDPTAVYGIKKGSQKITKNDLLRKTPYNTYQINGLPRGPIANPGLKSLEAVLYPAQVNYLYFVAKNDKTHYFSHSLEEHNRAVAKYQKKNKNNAGGREKSLGM
ncbi:MAG: endolytic transglycosylase MltG [Thermodesulfobacteriota bacterium]